MDLINALSKDEYHQLRRNWATFAGDHNKNKANLEFLGMP